MFNIFIDKIQELKIETSEIIDQQYNESLRAGERFLEMCDKNVITIEAHKDILKTVIQETIISILDKISKEAERKTLLSIKSNLSLEEINNKFNKVFRKQLALFAEKHNVTIITQLQDK